MSDDGSTFRPLASAPIGPFYLSPFRVRGAWYAIGKGGNRGGVLLRQKAGGAAAPFTVLKTMLPMMRHGSVWVHDGIAIVAYSLAGDHPERLLVPCCADVNRC